MHPHLCPAIAVAAVAFALTTRGLHHVEAQEAATDAVQVTAREAELSPEVERFLWWLPVNTETLIVAQGPFALPRKPDGRADALGDRDFLDSARGLAVFFPGFVRDGELFRDLPERVELAVAGNRRFRDPTGLGMMRCEGCQILKFPEGSERALKMAHDVWWLSADDTDVISGRSVVVFRERLEDDDWSFYLVLAEPRILLCATDRDFLETVLKRMNDRSAMRALPEDLPEWRQVNTKASVWAVRHYRVDQFSDPSSPLRGKAAANLPDRQAIGFVFWYGAEGDEQGHARYLSTNPEAVRVAKTAWSYPGEAEPMVERIAPGVVAVRLFIDRDDDKAGTGFLFLLLGFLGHAVYV